MGGGEYGEVNAGGWLVNLHMFSSCPTHHGMWRINVSPALVCCSRYHQKQEKQSSSRQCKEYGKSRKYKAFLHSTISLLHLAILRSRLHLPTAPQLTRTHSPLSGILQPRHGHCWFPVSSFSPSIAVPGLMVEQKESNHLSFVILTGPRSAALFLQPSIHSLPPLLVYIVNFFTLM